MDLITGLNFAKKYKLTQKEIEALIPFFEKPYITNKLAELLEVNRHTLQHIIQKLKLKGLLVLKDRDAVANNIYELDLTAEVEI